MSYLIPGGDIVIFVIAVAVVLIVSLLCSVFESVLASLTRLPVDRPRRVGSGLHQEYGERQHRELGRDRESSMIGMRQGWRRRMRRLRSRCPGARKAAPTILIL